METLTRMFDYLHNWDSFEPAHWKHRLAMDLMRNMRDNLSHYYLQLETTDEFERKIRLKSCQNMLLTLKTFKTTYDLDSDQDMKLYSDKMMKTVNEMIVKYCKIPTS